MWQSHTILENVWMQDVQETRSNSINKTNGYGFRYC